MKMPVHHFPRESAYTRATKRLAATINNQQQLDATLAQMNPVVREAARAQLIPYLKFRPADQPSLTPIESRPA